MDQLFRLIDLFVRKGLPFDIVGQILIYTIPLIFSYTAPMAVLVAVIMTFGRFAQDNEILALKTSGFTFIAIMKIPLVITLIFTGLLIFFNSYLLPEANHRVRNLMLDVSRKRPAIRIPEGVFTNDFTGYTVYIGKKDERHSKLYDITIYDLRNNLMITAPNGELKDFEENGILQFTLYNGELHQLLDNKKYQRTKFSKQIINMKVDTELIRKERKYRNQNELSINGLYGKIAQTKQEIAKIRNEILAMKDTTINAYVQGNPSVFNATRFKIEKKFNQIRGKTKKISRYEVELNKKFSLAIACILFVIIGAPLGVLLKKGGIGGILIGVLLFSVYYILVLTGEEFAERRGFSPFWAMWLPDILLLIGGLYLFIIAEFKTFSLKKLLK